MSKLNFGQDADDYHDRHRSVALRDEVTLKEQPRFPWLTLFLVVDIIVAFAIIWFVSAPR